MAGEAWRWLQDGGIEGEPDCPSLSEADCEKAPNNEFCYWAFQREFQGKTPGCERIPHATLRNVCVCALEDNSCGAERVGGTGCQPTRFCNFVQGACKLRNAEIDSACLPDGTRTDGVLPACIPSDYCIRDPDDDDECIWNKKSLPGPPPTVPPTLAPSTATETPPPSQGITAAPNAIQPVAVAAPLAAVLALVVGFFMFRNIVRKKPEELNLDLESRSPKIKNVPIVPVIPSRLETEAASAAVSQPPAQVRLRVAFDFEGEHDDELTVMEGDKITGLSKVNDEWWEAETASGVVGLIPVAYVEPAPETAYGSDEEDDDKPEF